MILGCIIIKSIRHFAFTELLCSVLLLLLLYILPTNSPKNPDATLHSDFNAAKKGFTFDMHFNINCYRHISFRLPRRSCRTGSSEATRSVTERMVQAAMANTA